MAVTGANSAKFEEAAVLELTNKSGNACTLTGYPDVQFVGPSGDMPTKATHGAGKVVTVTVAPAQKASVGLLWNKYEGQGSTCPPFPTSIRVSLPGEADGTVIPWVPDISGSVCGGKIAVGPFAAGT
jgi:hypothetical protein